MALANPTNYDNDRDQSSLMERSYRELEELIVTLKLTPGSVLSEGALSRTLGIGRTPIREALQRLSMEGLIVVMPRRGILVSEVNIKNQLELLKVRREVERLVVRLSSERATPGERAEFQAIGAGMRDAAARDDDVCFMRLDQRFDDLLASSCRNDHAKRAMGVMMGSSRRFWYMHFKRTHELVQSAAFHADIAEAVGAGHGDEAAKACDRHIDYVAGFTRRSADFVEFRL